MAFLGRLWSRPEGIGYLEIPLDRLPPPHTPRGIDRWFASLELLARLFPTWTHFAGEAIEWLWEHRLVDGLWDFGPRPGTQSYFPLSDSWRRGNNRAFDVS